MLAALLFALAAAGDPQHAKPTTQVQQKLPATSLSPAGQAAVTKYLGAPDPQIEAMGRQMQNTAAQVRTLSTAPKIDLAKLETAVHQQERLESAIRVRANGRMLALLKVLSDADRVSFLRSMAQVQAGARAEAARAAAGPPNTPGR